MTDEIPVLPAPAGAMVWVERIGPRQYRGHTPRGSEVLIGGDELAGGFWPGELVKLGLAGCAAMSADRPVARRLGDAVPITAAVTTAKHASEDRFVQFDETLVLDLTGLSDEDKAQVRLVAQRAIEATCTVGLTLANGAAVNLAIEG
jgi:uncharacterized OsmC-like protein